MINVAFLLDITGSMNRELHGVKATVARLVKTVFLDFPNEVVVTIITFTEDPTGCFVTRASFIDGREAVMYVNRIVLCVPPGMPKVNANGGDGPENHKAALAELLRLDATVPTVAFMITDAVPHLLETPSVEATLEKKYLRDEFGLADSDLFTLLDRVVNHFGTNLVLSVVNYKRADDHALYGAVAKRFNGVLVTPGKRTPEKLADGLMAILLQMFASLAGQASEQSGASEALSAFAFYDLEAIDALTEERDLKTVATPTVGSTDELLFKLIERTTVIAGSRFQKRAITTHAVQEQVELLIVVAKGFVRELSKYEALSCATEVLAKIKKRLGNEHASQFKLHIDEINTLLSKEFPHTDDLEAVASDLTLLSVEEAARDATLDDDDPYAALLAVASLFLGHLSVLQLPNRDGVVDFMDAWSAVIHKVSNDIVSAADFLTMSGDKERVAGLRRRENEYNFLQLVADANDAIGSALLRVASGTQIPDILTALMSGAPRGLFSPNMFRGTIAASLMTLLSTTDTELSDYQWTIAHNMVHTVRLLIGATPTSVEIEPESAIAKLLFRVLRVPVETARHRTTMLRTFLEELAAARAQTFARTNVSAYLALVEKMVGYKHDDASVTTDVFATHLLLDYNDHALNAAHVVAVVKESKFYARVECVAQNVLRAVFQDRNVGSLTDIWPTIADDLAKLLLLQKRTERYTLQQTKTKSSNWVRNEAVMTTSLESTRFRARALALMRQKYDAFVRATLKLRQDAKAQKRWRQIVALMYAPFDQFVKGLNTVVCSSSRRGHMLLLKALTVCGPKLRPREYERKVTAVVTGRIVGANADSDQVVFNRGNLHAHPDRVVPMTGAFKAKLREWQRTHGWSTAHVYRESGVPNHHRHSKANPSAWAAKRSNAEQTFWEQNDYHCEFHCGCECTHI